jgi:hypothetical protein
MTAIVEKIISFLDSLLSRFLATLTDSPQTVGAARRTQTNKRKGKKMPANKKVAKKAVTKTIKAKKAKKTASKKKK